MENISSLKSILEFVKQKVMNHGGFDFLFIKDYAGEKNHEKDFIIQRGGGYGSLALDRRCIDLLIKELNRLLSEYKKAYVESGNAWRGYDGWVNGWGLSIVYNAQADVVTISEKEHSRSFINHVVLKNNYRIKQKLRCRIDDIPYIIDGLRAVSTEYRKFYKSYDKY